MLKLTIIGTDSYKWPFRVPSKLEQLGREIRSR